MAVSYWARWACNGQVADLPELLLLHVLAEGYELLTCDDGCQAFDRGGLHKEDRLVAQRRPLGARPHRPDHHLLLHRHPHRRQLLLAAGDPPAPRQPQGTGRLRYIPPPASGPDHHPPEPPGLRRAHPTRRRGRRRGRHPADLLGTRPADGHAPDAADRPGLCRLAPGPLHDRPGRRADRDPPGRPSRAAHLQPLPWRSRAGPRHQWPLLLPPMPPSLAVCAGGLDDLATP